MSIDPYDPAVNPVVRAMRNRNNFPAEELWKHIDQWIAWSPDCTRIVAASDDMAELEQLVKAEGMDMKDTTVELVLDPDIAFLGGA